MATLMIAALSLPQSMPLPRKHDTLFGGAAIGCNLPTDEGSAHDSDVTVNADQFEAWVATHNKTYSTPEAEAAAREAWEASHAMVEAHNAKPHASYSLGHNDKSDWTPENRRIHRGGHQSTPIPVTGEGRLLEATKARSLEHQRALTGTGTNGQACTEGCASCGSEPSTSRYYLTDCLENQCDSGCTFTLKWTGPYRSGSCTCPPSTAGLPASIDWVAAGKVAAVRDQGGCGSCYAFAATAAIESKYAIENNAEPFHVSTQQIVSCNTADKMFDPPTYTFTSSNGQCNGGNAPIVNRYAGGSASYGATYGSEQLCQDSDYPYTAGTQNTCTGNLACTGGKKPAPDTCSASTISACSAYVTVGDTEYVSTETELMTAIQTAPVAVSINALDDLSLYKHGIYSNSACGLSTDHAVLAVGYGTDAKTGMDYWILKNSWGSTWGMGGYFKMERGVNMCGIGYTAPNYVPAASYPTTITLGGTVTASAVSPPLPPSKPKALEPWANPNNFMCGSSTPHEISLNVGTGNTFPCTASCSASSDCPAGNTAVTSCGVTSGSNRYCQLFCMDTPGYVSRDCPTGMSCYRRAGLPSNYYGLCVHGA